MIIKGGSRSNGRFFARHLTNSKDNDRVRLVEFKGFAKEDVPSAFQEMKADAMATRCENYFYHADLSPREDERLSDEQWGRAVDTLERHLGLENQPRFVVEHEKEGRTHRHVVWSRIDADTMTARPDSLTYRKHEAAAREIESDCGLEPVASVLVKDREGPRPARRARDWEGLRGSQSGLTPELVTRDVTALWLQCDSGPALKAALEERGYVLCRGDRRDFCIIDPAGDDHSLARRIQGARAADVRERLKDIDASSLPSVAEGRELADAWAGRSEAARAVQEKEMERNAREWLQAAREKGVMHVNDYERDGWVEPPLSGLEKAARQYGQGVKDVARGLQDAYWQSFVGGKPKTEADKLHDVMWGEKDKEPEPER